MIAISDIPEMIEDLRQGTLRMVDVEGLLLDLLAQNEVRDIAVHLPDDVRVRFEALLCEIFSEGVPSEDIYLFDSARGMHPKKDEIIASARRWLRSNTSVVTIA
jgi:hypothetical protein